MTAGLLQERQDRAFEVGACVRVLRSSAACVRACCPMSKDDEDDIYKDLADQAVFHLVSPCPKPQLLACSTSFFSVHFLQRRK